MNQLLEILDRMARGLRRLVIFLTLVFMGYFGVSIMAQYYPIYLFFGALILMTGLLAYIVGYKKPN